MIKKMQLAIAVFAIVATVCLYFSCASNYGASAEDVFQPLNYTNQDVYDAEIGRIEKILEDDAVLALWRTMLLKQSSSDDSVNDLLSKCFEKCVDKYNLLIEEKKFYYAYGVFCSLKACQYEKLSELSYDEEKLISLSKDKMNIGSENEKYNLDASINGTVTVWVDRGIAINNGVGYADRVIGSGFFISSDGYLITNHHVIEDVVDKKSKRYSRLFIKLASDSDVRIPAKVIGYDKMVDLALLKVEMDAPYVFNLGASSELKIGDKIYAIGSPVGLDRTLTSGIVSAKDRKLFSVGNVFQIDAAVNQGNSGGPMIDEKGYVQAVVFAGMLQFEGLNFAIPVEYLRSELPILFSGGMREHVWIGAFGKTKKEMGKDIGLEVLYVMPGGYASRAGILEGDVITEINGHTICNNDDLQNFYMKSVSGTICNITVKSYNDNDVGERNVLVYLGARPENPGKIIYKSDLVNNSFFPLFGMKLRSVSTSSSKKYAIEKLLNGSIADESGFSENDTIDIGRINFNDDNTAIQAEIYTKKRKSGYLDVGIALATALDSPYYF